MGTPEKTTDRDVDPSGTKKVSTRIQTKPVKEQTAQTKTKEQEEVLRRRNLGIISRKENPRIIRTKAGKDRVGQKEERTRQGYLKKDLDIISRKEDPRIIRVKTQNTLLADISIFVGITAFLIIISFTTLQNVGMNEKFISELSKQHKVAIDENIIVSDDQCGLYLAESSIPGSGLGIFSGKIFKEGQVVSESGITIPIYDTVSSPVGSYADNERLLDSLRRYNLCKVPETNGTHAITPHLKTIMKYHSNLSNVDGGEVECGGDQTSEQIVNGSIEHFSCRSTAFKASRLIHPGHELFLNYADIVDRTGPMYRIVDQIVEDEMKLARVKRRFGENKKERRVEDSVLKLVKKTAARFDESIASLLPERFQDLERYSRHGCSYQCLNNHTLPWLEKNGKCIDNIKPGESTIKEAGTGAFAKRFISKESLIVPAILHLIKDESTLNVVDHNTNIDEDSLSEVSDQQILINYCFGHSKSTVLFCQMTSSAMINHKSSPSNCRLDDEYCESNEDDSAVMGPNAEYQWSSWNPVNDKYLSLSLDELEKKIVQGLSLDIISTRDIQSGEEIFIDYGKEWEVAWDEHCRHKKKPMVFRQPIGIRDDIFPIHWKNKV